MVIAVTGATGFIGSRLLHEAREQGLAIRALTRNARRPLVGVEWVAGALEDGEALRQLVAGTRAVIHLAAVISADGRAGFEQANVGGTAALVEAARAAGVERLVHVSSLAARQPELSLYGASKAGAELLVERSGLDWAIVRPPAVYGPGDRETLELFKMAQLGLMLLPPGGRLSLIHADDLARLLLMLATGSEPRRVILEPDDGRPGGWSHSEFAAALAATVGRQAVVVTLPRPLLSAAALLDRLLRGRRARLTADRVAYFCHPDWVADPARGVPPELWRPRIATDQGLAETAQWYVGEGWLKSGRSGR